MSARMSGISVKLERNALELPMNDFNISQQIPDFESFKNATINLECKNCIVNR